MDLLIEIIKQYGWQATVVSMFVFATIECIKPFARKAISKSTARHSLYMGLNYVLTFGYSVALTLILGRFETVLQLYGSSIVVVNILYPIIANVGFFDWVSGLFRDFFAKKSELGSWKAAIKSVATEFGIDQAMLNTVATKVGEEYKQLIADGAESFFTENQTELVLNMKQKLAGFVDNEILHEVAEHLFTALWGNKVVSKSVEGDGVYEENN